MKENWFFVATDNLSDSTSHDDNTNDLVKVSLTKEQATFIRVDLIPDNGLIETLWLPILSEGRFQFENINDSEVKDSLYFLIGKKEWYVCAIKPTYLIGEDKKPCHILKINDRNLIDVRILSKKYRLYIELVTNKDLMFCNYQIFPSSIVSIGRSDDNEIIYNNQFVAGKQATIYWNKNDLYIKVFGSINDLWINGKKCVESNLKLGDVIYCFGLVLIIGIGFIAVNDRKNGIRIKEENLCRISSSKNFGFQATIPEVKKNNKLFNRLPRRKQVLEPKTITIEAPPISLNSDNIPLLLRMGGSMAMSGASALSGNFLMLISSVLFPILTQKYSDKEKQNYEARRLDKYREYLKRKSEEIVTEKEYEERILRENYPDLNCVLEYAISKKKLWERRKTDSDFLNIRVGCGKIPMQAKIEYPDQHFNMDVDILEQEMYELAETSVTLEKVPIMVDFVQNFICSISGHKKLAYSFLKKILMRIAVLHSYDEVKIVVLVEKEDLQEELEFVKYIPHVWDDQKSIRFIATEPSEAYQIGELIQRDTEEDLKRSRNLKEIMKKHPYYMFFALSKRIFDSMEILKDLIQQDKTCGVSVITAFNDLPKECKILLDLKSPKISSIVYLDESSRGDDIFKADSLEQELAKKSMKIIANISLKNVTQAYSLPKVLTFLEMYKVGKVEHLNVAKRWIDNNPVKSLAVPVGVATDGSLFYLDLHQKYQGPHGLVAGTTGSGKSEFLLTYILSMAINYHPDEVAFVLIDYKGGGLAGAFDDPTKGIHLPHLVGTITNLDGASIQRSLVSIQSELTRRQKIFNEVKSLSDEGTMDIYTYQRLYRSKVVSEPMPHLFIISDEFAELKQQQPDFMEQLISAARIGRSLGVHLILATQKPAGVVNDQIRSNTKFRVCLKVQDKADSQDMLKRPEAAELKDTGRFYLQVGYNEFFALGQSAWSGADYEPQDEVVVQKDESVQVIDSVGQTLVEVKPIVERSVAVGTQLVAIVKMLTKLSLSQNISVRQLWKPELKKKLDIVEINNNLNVSDEISCALGIVDDPENQEQYPFIYNFEQSQHLLIVGDASSGKTSLIQGMLYWLCKNYSPKQLNFYALDFSSRMIKKFKNLPHCGAVLLEEELESIDSFFEIINNIVLERKKIFLDLGVDSYSAVKEKIEIPMILVIVDNILGLGSTRKGEQHLYRLQGYLKDALNYGIKYIVSCSHLNDLSSKIRQELGDRLCLHMRDKYEYGEALNCKVNYTPSELPGRGLCVVLGRPLEIQMSIFDADITDIERVNNLEKEILNIIKKYERYDVEVRRIPVISEDATYEEFLNNFSRKRIPLGYSKQSHKAIALPLRQLTMLSIYQGNDEGIIPILKNFLLAIKKEHMNLWFVRKSIDSKWENCLIDITQGFGEDSSIIESKQPILEQLWHDLAEEISIRIDLRKKYCEEQKIGSDVEEIIERSWNYMLRETQPLILVIENYADFCLVLDEVSVMVFDKLFHLIKGLNVYIIGFFASDDSKEVRSNYLYSGFNTEETIMLFGGAFEKQSLIELPEEAKQAQKKIPFNLCIMKYRKSFHILSMPCGEIKQSNVDTDSQDIFI